MKYCIKYLYALGIFGCFSVSLFAQGPPITSDKPIMLGGGSFTAKTLIEHRKTAMGTFKYTPIMLHYLISSNALVAILIPTVSYETAD